MKTFRSLTAGGWLLLAGAAPATAALDFSLHRTNISADGARLAASYITDGPSKIFLRFPADWKVSDGPQALDCLPGVADSRVRIETVGGTPALPIGPADQPAFGQNALKQVPAGAKDASLLPLRTDLLPIFGWKTLEATCRFEFYGRILRRSVLVINMQPGRVVQVSVIALDADFDAVHEQMRLLLSGWFEPSKDLPPDLARQYEEGKPGGS